MHLDAQAVNDALRRLQRGDRSAAPAVFSALWPIVLAFCRRALGDGGQDAAQDALVKLFGQAGEFRPEGNAVAWALEIAGWQCRTELRRRAREATSKAAAGPPGPEAADASERLEREQLTAALRESLTHLSPTDQAIVAAVVDGSSPPGADAAARKRKERALARLKSIWSHLYASP